MKAKKEEKKKQLAKDEDCIKALKYFKKKGYIK